MVIAFEYTFEYQGFPELLNGEFRAGVTPVGVENKPKLAGIIRK